METKGKKKGRSLKIILAVLLLILSIAGIFIYDNFNKLLSIALVKSFNSGNISEVYELKFESLSVNFALGNIKVYNVELIPLKKPKHNYPYINTTFHLKTHKILLKNVEILTLLKTNTLRLDKIEIVEPDVELNIANKIPILFPFKDTTEVANQKDLSKKKSIEAFSLKEFSLTDASFHIVNTAREREFRIKNLNITLNDLFIDQQPGMDLISYSHINLSIGEVTGNLKNESIKDISFKDYKITIDSLHIQKSLDTLIYHFYDFSTDISALEIQTADSLMHFSIAKFQVSYLDKSIKLKNVLIKPNISIVAMQRRYKYQHTQMEAEISSLEFNQINFDTLIYSKKIFIDEILADGITASIYKDNTKPVDVNHLPIYFGQQINSIDVPLQIKQVNATNLNLVNTEKKPDGAYGRANITKGTLRVTNISNLESDKLMTITADAFIEKKAHAYLKLGFSYKEAQFSVNGRISKFNLTDLNALIQSYTPAHIHKGTADEISFSGMVYRTNSTGTMKFLYHDLNIDLELKEQAKWKSTALAFAANTALNSANPVSAGQPPRIVKFKAERNMNKGFINIIIKSVLDGLKETMIMSKENRKTHKESVKKARNSKE